MIAASTDGATFVGLVAQGLEQYARWTDPTADGPDRTVREAADVCARSWHSMIDRIRELDTECNALLSQLDELRPEVVESRRAAAAADGARSIDAIAAAMRSAVDNAATSLDRLARVQRPTPVDPVQVALVAERRAGWKMALDATPSNDIVNRMLALLAENANDPLALWAIAGDDWGDLYVESRGLTPALWRARVNQAVATFLPVDSARAVELLERVVRHRYGLNAVVIAAHSWGSQMVRTLADGRAVSLPAA